MKIKTVYIADDGRQFSSRHMCEKYEADGCVEFFAIPAYGDHVLLTEESLRWMLNGDGDCYYATATKRSRTAAHPAPHPQWATHLIYFGK